MDGYKIRAKLALNFPRAVTNNEAEDVMMQYARAFATAVECELSNGDLPFEEQELLQRITDQVSALPKKNVRLIGLHVWHKGAISSGSMLAVKPERDGKPTVPAMPAVSQTREKAPSSAAIHAATTVKPPVVSEPAPASAREMVNTPAPARASMPAMQRAAAPTGASAHPRPTTTSARAPAPGTGSVRMPSAVSPASRMTSGVMPAPPAVEPRIVRSKSAFLLAVEQCSGSTGEAVGRALAQPVRDAAASVLLATLDALHGSVPDPLGLLDGRASSELRQGLVGEACVCVCYVLYESLTRTSLPQMLCIEVVQGACVHALEDKMMPVSEISRYLATESPREEFSGRICSLLGVRENGEMQQKVDSALRALRLDVRACAEQVEQRLGRASARSGQKTG